jgi:hypothetical protein
MDEGRQPCSTPRRVGACAQIGPLSKLAREVKRHWLANKSALRTGFARSEVVSLAEYNRNSEMKPTDAEKFYLLVSALDRLAVAVEQGEEDERVDALLAAEEAKRLAEAPGGPLSATEIEHLQLARAANEIATAKYASALAPRRDDAAPAPSSSARPRRGSAQRAHQAA